MQANRLSAKYSPQRRRYRILDGDQRVRTLAAKSQRRKESRKMKEYQIQIKETLALTVTVEAESAVQAREMVERGYMDSEYILDASHYKGVTFSMPKERNRER
jgi:hypothetical protein